uniref:Protein SCAF8 n=1 Tax=Castor canadensis TaxID=51338 RepID=A0A8C0XXU4_CASCN
FFFLSVLNQEYKVPGLYFGQEKGCFAPRFSNNIISTFQNLYRCPGDDKSKIVRVLNLWQKNNVFKSEIIQPLLDMAAGIPPPVVTPVLASTTTAMSNTPGTPVTPITNTDTLAAVAQILQSPQGQQVSNFFVTLRMIRIHCFLMYYFKLMDRFDFGDDSDSHVSESVNNSIFHQIAEQLQQQNLEHLRQQLLEQQQPQKATPQDSQEGTFGSEHSASPSQGSSQQHFLEPEANLDDSIDIQQQDMDIDEGHDAVEGEIFEQEAKKVAVRSRSRTHSRSRSRSPRKRRSRSRSGSRKRKHRKRSRSRSRERKRKSSRSYSSERRAREREKERQKKGLPPIRSKTLSVCSTTLWVGQVDKKATQQDLTNLFEEFGQIESINMIPPRGCAYVCMVHRQDAFRALQKLSSGSYKIGSKVIKIAWALNKGVKTEYKQFWDVDLGVTYIPWEKVKVDDLDGFAEGGMIDQETVDAEWETVKSSEPIKETVQTTQSPTPVEKETVVTTQAEVFPPPVAMLQIPVAPAVPTVSLVPPAFPVSMPVPPPGFSPIPPPPFLRASFNPSQPPPGFMPPPVPPPVVPPPAIPPVVPTSLVQPPLSMTPETVKDVGFGSLVLPGGSVASSLATSTLPAGNVFNPPTKQAEPEEKVPHLIEHQISSGENTRSVIPNDIPSNAAILGGQPPNVTSNSVILGVQRPNVSSNSEILGVRPVNVSSSSGIIAAQPPNILNHSGILGIQPPSVSSSSGLLGVLPPNMPNNSGLVGVQPPNVTNASGLLGTQPPAGPQNLPPLNIPNQRMPALPMLDIRPGLIPQAPGPRFPLIQPGIPPQRGIPPPSVLDSPLHPPPRGPFPPADIFSHPERPFLAPGRQSVDNVTNPDKRIPLGNDNIQQEGDRDYRFPPIETREGISRPPPVDVRDVVGRPIDPREGPGRPPLDGRDHFGRPPVDMRENLVRPGIDHHLGRRDHFGFTPEKPWGHRGDFDEREHRVLPVYGGPKGLHEERGRFRAGNYRFDPRSGPWNRGFGQEVHRDFDDRRRPWERQRDRDDRDFDFCREINGNRLGRERIQNTWVPPPHTRVFDYFEGATSQRKGDNVPQVNGENTERHAQPPPLPVQNDPELYEKLTSSSEISKEKTDTVADIESEPVVVESTETEGT